MKKILFILFTCVLMLPISLSAANMTNYDDAIDVANKYIKRYDNYDLYFETQSEYNKFVLDSTGFRTNSSFRVGGFINKSEFDAIGGANSYLYNGSSYWTITASDNSNSYMVNSDDEGKIGIKSNSSEGGVRVTEFVLSHVKVTGKGTSQTPWEFINETRKHKVTIMLDGKVIPYVVEVGKDFKDSIYVAVDRMLESDSVNCGNIEYTTNLEKDGRYVSIVIPNVNKDVSCTITSKGRTYNVTLNANQGKVDPSIIKVPYNGTYSNLPVPTKEYKSFVGWYTSTQRGDRISNGSKIFVNGHHTLYARWADIKYDVTFNPNGGTVGTSSINVLCGSYYGNLPRPDRIGYTFEGWFTDKEGGTQIFNTSTVTNTKAHTLYARWTANKYTLILDGNGVSVNPSKVEVVYDGTYDVLPVMKRAGYDFVGWYNSRTGGNKIDTSASVKITNNMTLYARWRASVPVVIFDANGGISPVASLVTTYGSKYGTLPIPERTGYTFEGWFTSKEGGSEVTSSTVVTVDDDHTLYARWKAKTFTVHLDGNGVKVSPDSFTVTYDGNYSKLPSLERAGYIFEGWYTSRVGGTKIEKTSVVKIVNNLTLYARWKISMPVVTFDATGGTVSTASKVLTYGYSYGTLPIAERVGYKFDGWYTEKTGGTVVSSNTKVTISKDHSLYAHWFANKYTVYLNTNGGNSLSNSSYEVYYGSKYSGLPTPKRTGYTFEGWYTSKEGGVKIANGDTVKIVSNTILYARWKLITPLVTFNANGGSVSPKNKIISYGGIYDDLPVPVRVGYTFEGWYTAKSSGSLVVSSTRVNKTSDHTIYARWRANKYSVILDGSGVVVSPTSFIVDFGSKYSQLPTLSKTGYNFKGWFTAKSGGTRVSNGSTVNIPDNVTLYAQWEPKKFSILFDPEGGTVYPSTKNVSYDSTYGILPVPKRSCYSFNGWFTSSTGGARVVSTTSVDILKNQTLYAQWTSSPESGGLSYEHLGCISCSSRGDYVYECGGSYTSMNSAYNSYCDTTGDVKYSGTCGYVTATYSCGGKATVYLGECLENTCCKCENNTDSGVCNPVCYEC